MIAWWNVNDFYHFRPDKINEDRWPKTQSAYEEKCRRVDRALEAMFKSLGTPQILGLGEITKNAAEALRDRILPTYRVASLDVADSDPTLQIALIYSSDAVFLEQSPIIVRRAPRGTRPMAVLDIQLSMHTIRCIFCHWQARMGDNSDEYRRRSADTLSEYVFDYVHTLQGNLKSHVLVIGDLNEEPFELPQMALFGHRHRSGSKRAPHWTDSDVKRLHLYNASWRTVGEKHPHPAATDRTDIAGTFYWRNKRQWLTIDQMLISGGLLSQGVPYFDEARFEVVGLPEFLEPDGLPSKFSWTGGIPAGLSDHLPVVSHLITGNSND